MNTRALTERQLTTLGLISRGFVSSSTVVHLASLVRRGLVDDLGLYDRENKRKRYGSDRYKITAAGWLVLKNEAINAR